MGDFYYTEQIKDYIEKFLVEYYKENRDSRFSKMHKDFGKGQSLSLSFPLYLPVYVCL